MKITLPPSIEQTLSKVPLFQGLSQKFLEEIASIVHKKEYRKGQLIFQEGDPGNGFYIVASGRIKVFKISPDGKEQILHLFGPGEPFGEAAVFAKRPFPASAASLEDSTILFLPRSAFVEILASDPALSMNMLGILSARLRAFASMIEQLSLRDVAGRLSAYLILLSERQEGRDELSLDMTKAQLAAYLGTIPETLSRVLAKMSSQNIITVDGARIIIDDRQALEDLAVGLRRLA